MKRRPYAVPVMAIFLGLLGLLDNFEKVRTVHALGLSASGFLLGFGVAFLLFGLVGPIRRVWIRPSDVAANG
jgi:hypothetical protein